MHECTIVLDLETIFILARLFWRGYEGARGAYKTEHTEISSFKGCMKSWKKRMVELTSHFHHAL